MSEHVQNHVFSVVCLFVCLFVVYIEIKWFSDLQNAIVMKISRQST